MLNSEAAGSNWSRHIQVFINSTSGGWNAVAGNTGFAYANALLGNFQSYSEDQFRPHTDIEQDMLQWYAQDQWKVSRRLSVNYGMRWGWHTPFYQRNDVGSSFDPSLWNASTRPLFYVPWCSVALPADGSACPTKPNAQFAVDPRRVVNGTLMPGTQLLDKKFVRSFIPGSGDLLDGLQLAKDPNTPKGYRVFSRLLDSEPGWFCLRSYR